MKSEFNSNAFRTVGFYSGIVIFLLLLLLLPENETYPQVPAMSAVASLMAVWWITEAVPLAVTSLLPIILFPVLGLLNPEQTAVAYINPTIFLFLGGFLIALAMERWNLHKRIAIRLILLSGNTADRIAFGFLMASFFISMWISNTATAMMMFPIGLALIHHLESEFPKENLHNLSVAIMLYIAYGSSIGGIGTLIGTAPNLSFQRIFKIVFPDGPAISFGSWLLIGLPVGLLMMFSAYIIVSKYLFPCNFTLQDKSDVIKSEFEKLGPVSNAEKIVMSVFLFTALLWLFRTELNLGFVVIPGWSGALPPESIVDDSTVAIFMGILLFLLPSFTGTDKNRKILDASVFKDIPWDIVLLFGGGFALAKGFVTTGLSETLGSAFRSVGSVHPFSVIFLIALFVTFLTELTSNTATAEMILPILASVSVALDIHPLLLMMTATISVSMAFMLPVATPPNAIVFGSKRLKVIDMARAGLLLNLVGAVIISLLVYYLVPIAFSFSTNNLPPWAK